MYPYSQNPMMVEWLMESSFAGSMFWVQLIQRCLVCTWAVCQQNYFWNYNNWPGQSQIILTRVLYGFSMGFSFHKWADLVTYWGHNCTIQLQPSPGWGRKKWRIVGSLGRPKAVRTSGSWSLLGKVEAWAGAGCCLVLKSCGIQCHKPSLVLP